MSDSLEPEIQVTMSPHRVSWGLNWGALKNPSLYPSHRDSGQNNSLFFCVLSVPHFSLPFHTLCQEVCLFIYVCFF